MEQEIRAKCIGEWKAQKGMYDSKIYWTLSHFSLPITGRISISAFASLLGTPIGITNSAKGL